MKKTKQIDTYYCDYCGKECEHTEFVMPYGEEKVEYAKDRYGNKIMPCHYTEPIAKNRDICIDCQKRIINLMKVLPYITKDSNGEIKINW